MENIRTFNARPEPHGYRNFKILFPTAESLRAMLNPNPTTKEEAMKNKDINEQMRKLGVADE